VCVGLCCSVWMVPVAGWCWVVMQISSRTMRPRPGACGANRTRWIKACLGWRVCIRRAAGQTRAAVQRPGWRDHSSARKRAAGELYSSNLIANLAIWRRAPPAGPCRAPTASRKAGARSTAIVRSAYCRLIRDDHRRQIGTGCPHRISRRRGGPPPTVARAARRGAEQVTTDQFACIAAFPHASGSVRTRWEAPRERDRRSAAAKTIPALYAGAGTQHVCNIAIISLRGCLVSERLQRPLDWSAGARSQELGARSQTRMHRPFPRRSEKAPRRASTTADISPGDQFSASSSRQHGPMEVAARVRRGAPAARPRHGSPSGRPLLQEVQQQPHPDVRGDAVPGQR
jgi:hypothetical protein